MSNEKVAAVAAAWTHDLAKDDDEDSRGKDGCESTTKVAEEDGQRLVDDDIAQEQDNEHPMLSLCEQSEHLRCPTPLEVSTRARQDLEVQLVKTHESERQTSEYASEQHEARYTEQVKDELTSRARSILFMMP